MQHQTKKSNRNSNRKTTNRKKKKKKQRIHQETQWTETAKERRLWLKLIKTKKQNRDIANMKLTTAKLVCNRTEFTNSKHEFYQCEEYFLCCHEKDSVYVYVCCFPASIQRISVKEREKMRGAGG